MRIKVALLASVIYIMSAVSAFAYSYTETVDPETGIRTFYLNFDDGDIYHASKETQAITIAEGPETAEKVEETETAATTEPEEKVEPAPVYGDITLTDEEANTLRWILCLEEEGFEEECRVCETIFNRVLSDKWPNTVGEVLKQRKQFSTYRHIGKKSAWDSPDQLEDDVISEVLRETSTRLPSKKYTFFDALGGVNGSDHVKYGTTTYGRER